MNPGSKLLQQARKRSRFAGRGYGYQVVRRSSPTKEEKFVMTVLRKNRSYFEFQPVTFCIPLKRQISPDFLVFSWNTKRLQTPHYIEIDGNSKELNSPYQVKRVEGLRYPLVRIWNQDIGRTHAILNRVFLGGSPQCSKSEHESSGAGTSHAVNQGPHHPETL